MASSLRLRLGGREHVTNFHFSNSLRCSLLDMNIEVGFCIHICLSSILQFQRETKSTAGTCYSSARKALSQTKNTIEDILQKAAGRCTDWHSKPRPDQQAIGHQRSLVLVTFVLIIS
jgi:hypothetical protein